MDRTLVDNQILIKVLKLHPEAVLPTRATLGSAGFDLYAIESAELKPLPGGTSLRTGIAVELPPGYELQVRGRSGLAFKNDVLVHVGTIDQDFRGEILVRAWNLGAAPLIIKKGDRIAQVVIQKIIPGQMLEVNELGQSERGTGGFGHTGQ